MRVALIMDFDVEISRREGITVFVGYLFDAFMKRYPDTELEVWLYDRNREHFEKEYSDIIAENKGKIHIFSEKDFPIKKRIEIVHFVKYEIYKYLCYFSRLIHFERGDEGFGSRAAFQYSMHKQVATSYNFYQVFNEHSTADVSFVPYPGLRLGAKIDCPCVLQIHDLFTFPLLKLFNEEFFPRARLNKGNKLVKENVERYVCNGATLVCSSEFTRDHEILKYISGAQQKDCEVVPFPPMFTQFGEKDILSEEQFRDKYNIIGNYVAFPSQIRPNKNVILLLKALKLVEQRGIDLKLVTTGKLVNCNSTAEFKKKNPHLSIELGNLSTDELYCLYKYSSMVVCPNIVEGLGMSGQCLEGLSAKKPIIHAKSWGIDGSLKNVGLSMDTAKLHWVDFDDYKGLADEIEYVFQNQESVIEEQSNILPAYQKKTWNDVAGAYYDIFMRIKK